jgi:hypothetical protein
MQPTRFKRSGNSVVPHQTKKRADVDFTDRKRPGVRSANRSDHEEAPTRVNRGFFGLTGTDHWGQSIQSVPISSWLVGSKGTIRPSSGHATFQGAKDMTTAPNITKHEEDVAAFKSSSLA